MRNKKDRILLVEDDKIDQMAFERIVKNDDLSYDYMVVGSVNEAKSILENEKFDAVLMDYMLEDGTGFDLLENVNKVPFIIITGAGDEDIAVKAIRAGAHDYLIKDIEGNYLKTLPLTVKNAIKRRREKEELIKSRQQLEKQIKERTNQLQAQITESKQVHEVQQYRLNFEKLIAEISADFINLPFDKLDDGINKALKAIAEFAGAVQSSVLVFSDNSGKIGKTYEWSAEPIDFQNDQPQGILFEKFDYFKGMLQRLENIVIHRFDDLSTEAQGEREWLKEHGFRPLLFIPIIHQGTLYGALGFSGKIDEERKWSEEFISLLKSKTGFLVNTLERKRMGQELHEREEQFNCIFKTAKDSIFVKDSSLKYTYVNPSMEKFFGIPASELIGRTDEELVGKDAGERIKEMDFKVLNGETIEDEYIKPVNDIPATFHVIKMPMRDNSDKIVGLCGIARDITEQKQTEKEIQKLNEELKQRVIERTAELEAADEELKEFAYIVSHDFKAPLRAVNQLAHWISQDYANAFDDDGKEQLNLLIGRVKRMDKLIDGILQYSRLGRIKRKDEQVDINTIIKDVKKIITPPDNIEIAYDNTLPVITGNRHHIEKIFQNLLDNAIKFMDNPNGKIKIGCIDSDTYWSFSVEDNGRGIEDKYHEKIFQIFHSFSSNDKQENLGIGLTLVKKIIELNNGKIWLKSKPGEGSTFYFTLPKK